MKHALGLTAVLLTAALAAAEPPKPLVTGLKKPTAVAVGAGGRVYVTVVGQEPKSGAVLRIDNGKAVPFAAGLEEPLGIVAFQNWLFVTDQKQVWRIDARGKAEVFAAAAAFPNPPNSLLGITVDAETGTLYVGDLDTAIYRITPRGKVSRVMTGKSLPAEAVPHGLLMDGQSHLLVTSAITGEVYRIKLADGTAEKAAAGLQLCITLAWDYQGRLFAGGSALFAIPRPGGPAVKMIDGFQRINGICFDPAGNRILVVDIDAGTLSAVPISIPGHEVDETPLALRPEVAFPNLEWEGWKPEDERGREQPLRPIVLTHAGDGSNRVFVATQRGVIHVFPNDQAATKAAVFLDIRDRVKYNDQTNEEGFLGLAFHPKFKDNGELFVFYTTKKTNLTNVVSRFRVRKDDPSKADPASEEEILRFTKPFWNHDGGTIVFGPDGYLYITHGDGGAANDPYDNAQNLNRWLGKVLRIDIDSPTRISKQKNYAVPKDNPFVGRGDACPEIWAYGLRNVWRMAFDRETGKLWAGEVGQNLFEEINIIQKGGNYGWNRRESLHPFGPKGSGPKPEFIEPIWEYHHDVGKSITGGHVYRGSRLPELAGMYLYADYVTARIWALQYDEAKGRVVANRPIKNLNHAIFSFGEDERGEAYYLTLARDGKGIYRFVK